MHTDIKANELLDKAKALHASQNFNEALNLFLDILKIFPENPEVLFLTGTTCIQLKDFKKGIFYLKKSINIYPKSIGAINNLAQILIDEDSLDEAYKYLQIGLKLDSNNLLILSVLGSLFFEKKEYKKAIFYFKKVIDIEPNYFRAYFNLGNIFSIIGDYKETIVYYDKAIQLNQNYIEAYWNKALFQLLHGEFDQGWKNYEYRIKREENKPQHQNFSHKKSWRGQKIDGGILLIYGEQGFGDVIQFVRYLKLLEQFNTNLVLYISEKLITLISSIQVSVKIFSNKNPIPYHDYHCPIMSLPYVFQTTLDNIPNQTPYLFPMKNKYSLWFEKIKSNSKFQLGIAFSGSVIHKRDKYRSIKLQDFSKLFISGIDIHSLQITYNNEDLKNLNEMPEVIQHQKDLKDFSDTAALIANLDLVITVDTSIAHLAGALGTPVWILLDTMPDYRWLLERQDSPWYPSVKLFRQKKHKDWPQTILEVKKQLKNLVNN